MKDIVRELRREKRYAVLALESGEEIILPFQTVRETVLPDAGCETDVEELKKQILLCQYTPALHYAVDLLAKQPRAGGEIRRKLLQRHYLPETAEMVLYKLEKERLLDDGSFARQYAASRSQAGMGGRRIRTALMGKGVSAETVEEALQSVDPEESGEAAVLFARKLLRRYVREEDPRKRLEKMLGAMARRGYDYEESREAIRRAEKEE